MTTALLRPTERTLFKDLVLDGLASTANVAQFVSFDPALKQRYSRVHGFAPNHVFDSPSAASRALLESSYERSVNVRSFEPTNPKSRQFIYGLRKIDEVISALTRLAEAGLHTILNETIDVRDGGVSGVVLGDTIEFAPFDTPRAVEKPGTATLPREIGLTILETVYGFRPELEFRPSLRVEFSIHPIRRGFRGTHTIIWEQEQVGFRRVKAEISWPNLFSRFLGDKAFGLLVADALGAPVPETLVVARHVAPFRFGKPTGLAERWIRTCPVVQTPGRFTTQRGWIDPFRLLSQEDPGGEQIAAVLSQAGVEAFYSGAFLIGEKGGRDHHVIEGVAGFGDDFMIGRRGPGRIPSTLSRAIRSLHRRLSPTLGAVRFEWAADSKRVWILQLHRGSTMSVGRTIYPGDAGEFVPFDVGSGLEALRALVNEISGSNRGIILIGDVGITSHFGDVLRKARIPSRIESRQ